MGLVSSYTLYSVNYIKHIINCNTINIGIKVMKKQDLIGSNVLLAVIYTTGHIIIAMNTVYWLTGASLWEAGIVALVEPCINGVWFYILLTIWRNWNEKVY